MRTHEAFIKGYKPAFLCSHRYESDVLELLLCQNYPHVLQYELEDFDVPGQLFDKGTLFFQNKELKEQYLKEMEDIQPNTLEEDLILGQTLGFPPIACEFYVASQDDKKLKKKRAGYDYYGIRFVGNIDDLEQIVEWLWSNIPAPAGSIEVTYQKKQKLIQSQVMTT